MAHDPRFVAGLMTLHGLTGSQIAEFIDACIPAVVPAGTLLMARGDEDGSMLFVRDGELEVFLDEAGEDIVLRELRRGGHAGASSLLRLARHRPASVRSRTTATLLLLERESFELLVARCHPVVKNLEVEVLREQVADIRDLTATLAGLGRGGPLPEAPMPQPDPGLLERLLAALRRPAPVPEPVTMDRLSLSPAVAELGGLLTELLGTLKLAEVERGERLLSEGGDARQGFLVLSGGVGRFIASRERGQILLGVVEAGQLGGFESAVDGGVPLASCVAIEKSVVVILPHDVCADTIIARGLLARRLRRAVLADGFAQHEAVREMVFRGMSMPLWRGELQALAEHPDYWRAWAASARLA